MENDNNPCILVKLFNATIGKYFDTKVLHYKSINMVKTQESFLDKSSKTPVMENTTIKTQNNFTLLEEEQMVLGETTVFDKNKY